MYFYWQEFSAYQDNHAKERQSAAAYEAKASKSSPEKCRVIIDKGSVFDWLTCLAEQVNTDAGAKQADYDLKAQQDMAEWAYGMLIVTIIMTIFNIAGVFFLIWTIYLTREANSVSGLAANAAMEANRMAREGKRPWVCFSMAGFKQSTDGTFEHGFVKETIGYSIFMKNFGDSPAMGMSLFNDFIEIKKGDDVPNIPYEFASTGANIGVIGLGVDFGINSIRYLPEDVFQR